MFEDLRVLELASVLAGPAAGQFFAELGASVIKVENARSGGDITRFWKIHGEVTDDRSAYFCSVNWGKKSISLDLGNPEGKNIVHQLARQSDIIIASYKPGDAEKLGVDYDTLKDANPKLIYGQVTGYGPHNPRVGYDAVIQAESGFMFLNGYPGDVSLKMPVALIDILAAHHLKEGLLVALLKRSKTGKGELVEVSLIQAAIASLANQATNWLVGGQMPQKQGSRHPNISPYGDVFITSDGQEIILAIGSDRQFMELCELLQIQYLAKDDRFNSNQSRVANRDSLNGELQRRIGEYDVTAIAEALNASKIPAGVVQSVPKVFETKEAKELLMRISDRVGVRTYVAHQNNKFPTHFLPPPHVGEHTTEILRETLKMGPQAIERLLIEGAVR